MPKRTNTSAENSADVIQAATKASRKTKDEAAGTRRSSVEKKMRTPDGAGAELVKNRFGVMVPKNIKGVYRVDQPQKAQHGFVARLQRGGYKFQKFCADANHGGPEGAFRAAYAAYREMMEAAPPRKTPIDLMKRRTSRNSSGVTGVFRTTEVSASGKERSYWIAQWSEDKGRRSTKTFSVAEFGEEKAKKLAVEARERAVAERIKLEQAKMKPFLQQLDGD